MSGVKILHFMKESMEIHVEFTKTVLWLLGT